MATYVINLISGPGSGKTTMAALLFAEMKIHGYKVEYVQEYAKKLVWLKDYDKLNNQYLLVKKQEKLFSQIVGQVEYIITDGCLLHGLYYNKYHKDNVSNVEKTQELILESYDKFNNINIFIERGDFPYEQAGRIQDEEESRFVDIVLKEYMDEYEIEYLEVKSDRANILKIIKYINQKCI